MSSKLAITLYDISSTVTPQAWSRNTWKARIVLNYKRLPYKTEWLSYPDIEPTIKRLGGNPTGKTPEGKPLYTLPAIVDTTSGSPVVVTESLRIAEYLDEKYPERPVFPKVGRAMEYAFEHAFTSLIDPHVKLLILPPVLNVLDDRSKVYFRETRERWYDPGKKLEDWCPEGPGREAEWEKMKLAWDKLAAILDKNGPGVDFVAGGTHPTRADIVIVSYLAWIKAVIPDDWEKRMKQWNGGRWERLWKITEDLRAVH